MSNASNQQYGLGASLIPYSNSKLANSNLWNSNFNPISIFRTIEKSMDDVKNVIVSLNHMASFIDKRNIKNNREIDLSYLEGFSQVAWISAISRESEQFPAIMHKEKYKTLRATLYQEPSSLLILIEADLLCRQDNKISFEKVTYIKVQKAFSSSSSNTAAGTN